MIRAVRGCGGRRDFDKPKRRGIGGRLLLAQGDLFFQVRYAKTQMSGDAGEGQGLGQSHGLIPKRLGDALTGMRAVLTPVLELSGELVELVISV